MSKLLLLWWNNAHNHLWIQEVDNVLFPFFDETYIHVYEHWLQWSWNMDLDKEMQHILSHIDWDTVIFAKSLWTILAIKTIVASWIVPRACIFVWLPLWYVHNQWFPLKKYLPLLACSVLCIQHTQDPVWSYEQLVDEINGIAWSLTCCDLPGNDHDYKEVDELKKIISDFL